MLKTTGFGAGGNAWFAMYKQYQSYNYGSGST